MNACWGKLASEILMQNWDAALEDLNKVKEVIDQNVSYFFLIIICFPSIADVFEVAALQWLIATTLFQSSGSSSGVTCWI